VSEAAEPVVVELAEPAFRPLGVDTRSSDVSGSVEQSEKVLNRVEVNYAERAITPQNAYLVRSMMMDVVRRGTGVRAMELGRSDLAGKTGTTNDQRDAWFSGYNDQLVTTVWVGFDNFDPLGRLEQGGRAALPVWIDYMRAALEGSPDTAPEAPEGLARARIDPETGMIVTLGGENAIMEVFQAGRLPPVQENVPGAEQDAQIEEDPYEIY
jgi:penicillin-binding protein 1A